MQKIQLEFSSTDPSTPGDWSVRYPSYPSRENSKGFRDQEAHLRALGVAELTRVANCFSAHGGKKYEGVPSYYPFTVTGPYSVSLQL